tara:strand:- start:585 stop:968 length:384 start_codon:yes stop_codon:yes gene_type:complete
MSYIKEYLLFSLILTSIDAIYLKSISNHFNKQLKLIQGSPIELKPLSTFLCYILLTSGLFYFGIIKNMTIKEVFFLGIFVYGVYETTNHAIFKKWQWDTVVMDTVWGGILFSLSVFLFKKLNNFVSF